MGETGRMVIDTHIHYARSAWLSTLWTPRLRSMAAFWPRLQLAGMLLDDPAALVSALALRGVDRGIVFPELSLAPGPQMSGGAAAALALTREMNDTTAALVAALPEELIGLAIVNPLGGAEDLDELRRAALGLGLAGVAVGASYQGIGIDSADARPFLALAEALDLTVVVHPTVDAGMPHDFGLDLLLGMPQTLATLAVRLIVSGRLAEFPRLRIVLTHQGGGFLSLLGWLDTQSDGRFSREARRFWVDTATATMAGLAQATTLLGYDRVLYGSDWPLSASPHPGDRGSDSAAMLGALPLGAAGHAAVLAGNALQLFGRP